MSLELCTYKECSVAELCKRSVLVTKPTASEDEFLKEIEFDDQSKCKLFMPISKYAEKLYRMAVVPLRDVAKAKISDLSLKREKGKADVKPARA